MANLSAYPLWTADATRLRNRSIVSNPFGCQVTHKTHSKNVVSKYRLGDVRTSIFGDIRSKHQCGVGRSVKCTLPKHGQERIRMLKDFEFERLLMELSVPDEGRQLVRYARMHSPVREANSRLGNCIVWHYSKKMGCKHLE